MMRSLLLLVDDIALGILLKDIVGQILGVSQIGRDRGGGRTLCGTDDTRDLQLNTVLSHELHLLFIVKIQFCALVSPDGVSLTVHGICLLGFLKIIRGIEQIEGFSYEIVKLHGIHGSRIVIAAVLHERGKNFFNLALIQNTQHVKGHLTDLIVFGNDQHQLVCRGGPIARDHVVLLLQKLPVVDHLGHHGQVITRHIHQAAHARESIAHIVKDGGGVDLRQAIALFKFGDAIYLEIKIVGILQRTQIGLQLIIMRINVLLKGLQVVFLHLIHVRHHGPHRIIHINLARVTVILLVLNGDHGLHHSRIILRLRLNRKRIGRKGIFLHKRDISIDTVGKCQNQCDTDDTDTACK